MQYIGAVEAAERMGCSRETLLRKVRAGEIPYAQKMGPRTGAYLFDADEIDRIASERAA